MADTAHPTNFVTNGVNLPGTAVLLLLLQEYSSSSGASIHNKTLLEYWLLLPVAKHYDLILQKYYRM